MAVLLPFLSILTVFSLDIMNTNSKISGFTRSILVMIAGLLIVSVFYPIWRIELDAPQYPEGLKILIFADKIGGDLQIVNGLNHYIGMKQINPHDFFEFTILIYIIGFYAAFSILTALLARKKILYTLFALFLLFGVLSMIDFWRWEYNYGHNLDPNAAIIVPGMSYQPPLIGFKKLLNFGAYSIPDVGGYLLMAGGLLMTILVLRESKILTKIRKKRTPTLAAAVVLTAMLTSCGSSGTPEPITFNSDECENCKMTIADPRFACELLTSKGRCAKFDDVTCMMNYTKAHPDKMLGATYFICDYLPPNTMTATDRMSFVKGGIISAPMGGTIAAFASKDSAEVYKDKLQGEMTTWAAGTR